MKIASISLLVNDYDEAIDFYCNVMEFKLLEDTNIGNGKRWVVVSPAMGGVSLLLAKAKNNKQRKCIGNQTGGRVFLFLHVETFWDYYKNLVRKGVQFIEEPREEVYGTVVVFEDLYGNKWDLIEKK